MVQNLVKEAHENQILKNDIGLYYRGNFKIRIKADKASKQTQKNHWEKKKDNSSVSIYKNYEYTRKKDKFKFEIIKRWNSKYNSIQTIKVNYQSMSNQNN